MFSASCKKNLLRMASLAFVCLILNVSKVFAEEKFCLQNLLNKEFYEKIGEKRIREFADKSNLSSGEDIKRIVPYIKKANVLLEIGSGYGRAAHFINQEKSAESPLYLIEHIPSLVNTLRSQFSPPTLIIDKDLIKVTVDDLPLGNPDLVLWMWSGFSDFSLEGQLLALKVVKSLLAKQGIVIIDLPNLTGESNATSQIENPLGNIAVCEIEGIEGALRGFIPSIKQMGKIAQETGFILEKWEEYSLGNRSRMQYFLREHS